jgi:outer membrane protein OmpA-like peptidoglycan-associated protein/tetratricopeptide (TPR) repeat protein
MKRIYLLITLTAVGLTLSAQRPNRSLQRADAWFEKKEYRQAVKDYQAALKAAQKSKRTTSEDLSYLHTRLGLSYLNFRRYFQAEEQFAKALENGANDSTFFLNYGYALLANDNVNEAIEMFREVLKKNPECKDAKDAMSRAEFNLASMKDSRGEQNSVKLEDKLNIASTQYSLGWYKGSLLFACDRAKPIGDGYKIAPANFFYSQPLFNFRSEKFDGWNTPEELKQIPADQTYFVHSMTYDENSKTYYVTRCLVKADARDSRCNIYAYHVGTNGRVGRPQQQSFHNVDANIGHPTLSSDGNVMIFTSTKQGTSNLYIVQKTAENIWTDPQPLSSMINTDKNESYPQIYRDSMLLFSSDGHPGMGGFDIFYSKILVNGTTHALSGKSNLSYLDFSEPVNFGAPINSGADDVSFLLRMDAVGGFFISNRTFDRKNKSQIYSFEHSPLTPENAEDRRLASRSQQTPQRNVPTVEFVIPEQVNTEKSRINAEVANLNSKIFDQNAEVAKLNSEIASKNNSRIWATDDKEELALTAEINRLIKKKAEHNAEIVELNAEIIKHNNELNRINRRSSGQTDDRRSKLDDEITRQNALITAQNTKVTAQNSRISELDSEKTNLLGEVLVLDEKIANYEVEMAKLETESPVGQAEKAKLAEERERLIIAMDEHWRQRNKLIADQERLDAEREELYAQNADCSENLTKSNIEIAWLEAEIARHQSFSMHNPVSTIRVVDTVYVDRIVEVFIERGVAGEMAFLQVFFENNCALLKSESIPELNRFLASMRANPHVRVKISGHTCVVGTVSHNQTLSESRAKAIRDYLVQNGIPTNRLEYAGYNFSKPFTTNTTPEGRAQNRRIEIEIL